MNDKARNREKTNEPGTAQAGDPAREEGAIPAGEEADAPEQKYTGQDCPDHPGVKLAETAEGVGACSVPGCQYGTSGVTDGSHPELVARRQKEQERQQHGPS